MNYHEETVLVPLWHDHSVLFGRLFYDTKIAQEVPANSLEPEWAGYLRIMGGNDKQGMLLPYHVKLLLADGKRKRKSVCRWIVGPNIAVLSVVLVKQGEGEITGLTDNVPKHATEIKCFFNLGKEDVQKYIVRREVTLKKEGGKLYTKTVFLLSRCSPRIQHLVTPICLQHRHLGSLVHRRSEHQKEQKAKFECHITDKKAKVAALQAAQC
ncbi:40S ribosomal protein S6 [Mycena maculata]|uniref:40S ribosomal protein S6 n=1 Tax=Mycena maculata TaxID=230809 RepID=A0AAD7P2P6_9AGAR|nr:40S ribosomal protein S6 [Mycena maculata]